MGLACRISLHSCRKSCDHFAQKRPVEKTVDVEHILCLWGSEFGFWAKSALLGALGATCAQPVFSSRIIDGFGVLHLHFLTFCTKIMEMPPLSAFLAFFAQVEALLGILCLFLSPWVQKSRKCYHFCFKSMLQMASGRKVQKSTFCGLNLEWK